MGTYPAVTPQATNPCGDDPRVVAGVHRHDRRDRRDADDRGGARPRPRRSAVDLPLVLADAGGALPHGGRRRRPLRPPADVRRRGGRVRSGASALAGAAPTGAVLIVARALQGVGGAFLTTNSLALLRATYGDEAGKAIGLWTAFTSVATLGGPAGRRGARRVGLVALDLLPQPAARRGGALPRSSRAAPGEKPTPRVGRLDLAGAVLTAAGFGSLTYALVEGAAVVGAPASRCRSWRSSSLVELRSATPMLPLEPVPHATTSRWSTRRRSSSTARSTAFLVYFTIYVQFLGLSPFEAGLLTLPSSIALISAGSAVRRPLRPLRAAPLPHRGAAGDGARDG